MRFANINYLCSMLQAEQSMLEEPSLAVLNMCTAVLTNYHGLMGLDSLIILVDLGCIGFSIKMFFEIKAEYDELQRNNRRKRYFLKKKMERMMRVMNTERKV